MTIQELGVISEANGLSLSAEKLSKLDEYARLLRKKNQVVNLISRKDEENILSKHILHSLALVMRDVPLAGISEGARILDLGSGGGLPGIPMKIARPDLDIILCDSIIKKITAVSEMLRELELDMITIADRAENLPSNPSHKNMYDIIVTRAVAPLEDLVKWSFPLLKKGGVLLSLKGGNLENEKKAASRMRFVARIEESLLSLKGVDEFAKEEKKIVKVSF